MAEMSLPQGWNELSEPHPEHGTVAYTHRRYRHTNGFEIVIWSDIVEDAIDYTVEEGDQYSIEVYDAVGEYIEGESFETEEEAQEAANETMRKYPARE